MPDTLTIDRTMRAPQPSAPPAMSKEELVQLEEFRKQVMAKRAKGLIALSVQGVENYNGGQDVLLHYPAPVTNVGGCWTNNSTFVAPQDGYYYFAVDFVKDPYYHGGTSDDVYMRLAKGTAPGNIQYVGFAWAGENDCNKAVKDDIDRGTGAYHVILNLKQGEFVQTYVGSDGGRPWHIFNFNFSGHRLAE